MLNKSDITLLKKIHKSVLSRFKYISDSERYGVKEWWIEVPEDILDEVSFTGDCEDFALACRSLCWEHGFDSRLVVCWDETGSGHCVLEVEGLIFDNRQHKLVTKKKLEKKGYSWYAISGYRPGDKWHRVKVDGAGVE